MASPSRAPGSSSPTAARPRSLRDHRRQRRRGHREPREVREAEQPRQEAAPTASSASATPARRSCPRASCPSPSPGIVDSHPYATEQVGNTVYVADAGGNDIFSIATAARSRPWQCCRPTKVRVDQGAREGHRAARLRHRSQVRPRARADRRRDGSRRLALRLQPPGWSGGRQPGRPGPRLQGEPRHRQGRQGRARLLSSVNVAVADNGDVYVSQLFAGSSPASRPVPTRRCRSPRCPCPPASSTEDGLYATIDALKGNKSPKGKLAFIPFS